MRKFNPGIEAVLQRFERPQPPDGNQPPPVDGPEDYGFDRPRTSETAEGVSLDDFYAYMPQHSYIFAPTRDMWAASSVNARVPPIPAAAGKSKITLATTWLDRHRPVEQMTWAPGLPIVIRNRLISEGGWIERDGVSVFNLYRPPTIELGDALPSHPAQGCRTESQRGSRQRH